MDSEQNEVPVQVQPSRQVWVARLAVLGLIVLLAVVFLSDGPSISIETQGDVTTYRADSWLHSYALPWAIPIFTGVVAIFYLRSPGIFRYYGIVLMLIAAGSGFFAIILTLADHYVQVSPNGVVRQVGTSLQPDRKEIEFSKTAFLYIDEVPGDRRPEFFLVAVAGDTETRIPIYEMMKAALPQIIETAEFQGIPIEGGPTGEAIPAPLRHQEAN